MEEIWNGILRAIELIVTLNPEVMEITARSLIISFTAATLAAAIDIPLGGLIELRVFRGKRALVDLIQTLYGLPTVTVGLLVFLLPPAPGPLGAWSSYTPPRAWSSAR